MTKLILTKIDLVKNSNFDTANFDKDSLEALLHNIGTLGVDCTKEVEMSGILQDIDEDGLKWANSQVSLHSGCL